MFHSIFSPVAARSSLLRNMDPRVKAVSIFAFVALASTMNFLPFLVGAGAFVWSLAGFSRIPATYLLKRVLWTVPFGFFLIAIFPFFTPGVPLFELNAGFVSLAVTGEGMERALVFFLRVFTAVSALALLTATTGFRELMNALRDLRLPHILTGLIEFTVRYVFVLAEELQRMKTARRARSFEQGGSLLDRHALKTLGCLTGVLFMRSYERGERVFYAMLARGYAGGTGELNRRALCTKDVCIGAGIFLFALSLRLIEMGGSF
ncbi:MAG TPA: cobalt ECF transporter T component CbiQ [Bacillota bacterium]|nr:cobalt ECF transporter T component CbiQ [Bacillota bacterium]